jgi:RNA ligase (TIGR02306 family)
MEGNLMDCSDVPGEVLNVTFDENTQTVTTEITYRKLASVQKILDLQPIPGADAIEVATVLGWKVVVGKKDGFKVGDLIVYCEIDSILPEEPEFEFLRKNHFRIKTIRLRGQVSQGIVFPITVLYGRLDLPHIPFAEGDDVTELLNIKKYESYVPAQLAGIIKGNFPEFLNKTDETRIQAVPAVLYRHQNEKFYVTEKVDGSSMTVYFRHNEHLIDGEFGVCSRNLDIKETEGNSFWKTARVLDLENKLRNYGRNLALQGELLGPGVQGNKYKLDKLGYYVFNVFNIDLGLYFDYPDFVQIIKYLGLTSVPLVNDEFTLPNTVDELVEYSKGNSLLNKDIYREGIVLRPFVNGYDEDIYGRLSFKVINPDFLLKYDE